MSSSHLIAVFDDETGLVKAVEEIRGKDLQIEEVFTPYPIHEVLHAMVLCKYQYLHLYPHQPLQLPVFAYLQ